MMLTVSGFSEMSAAQLHHGRRNSGAGRLFDSLVERPCQSFSFAVGSAGRQAAHRLFSTPKVTPASMISGHISATVERARNVCQSGQPQEWLLILQDTT